MSIFYRLTLTISMGMLLPLGSLMAETTPAEQLDPCLPALIAPAYAIPAQDAATQIEADSIAQPQSYQFQLTGRPRLSQPGLVLFSDGLFYDQRIQQAKAFGSVLLYQPNLILKGEHLELNQQTQTALITQAQFQLLPSRAHGQAEQIRFNQQQRFGQLDNGRYSTCPLDNQAWFLAFKQLEINNQKRRLYAHHTRLYFQDIPILYTPYIDFPLDERASGFLFPTLSSHKTAAQSQAEPFALIGIPYYFNLAPNFDDTLTLMAMQHRGMLLDNEFRYLTTQQIGQLNLGWINDQLAASEGLRYVQANGDIVETDLKPQQRWRLAFNATQNWQPNLTTHVNWHAVSDPDIYNDIPFNSLNASLGTQSHLTTARQLSLIRQLRLDYRQGPIQAHIQHYGYLPLRGGENNVLEKHPEIGVNLSHNWGGLRAQTYLESTEFVRYDGFNSFTDIGYVGAKTSQTNYMGKRHLIQPALRYQLDKPYGQFQLGVKANYRQYDLIQTPASIDAHTENTVWQYWLRGGLVFERDLSLFSQSLIQTLEPEIQYLYVPFVNQTRLANFDTHLASLDFSNIFQTNRFSGVDRIGDTEQISVALSSKLLDPQGQALAELAAGQILFLRDRHTTHSNTLQTDSREQSDYFVKARLMLAALYLSTDARFDSNNQQLTHLQNRAKITLGSGFNLVAVHQALNLTDATAKQHTLAAGLVAQLHPNWELASYIHYDLVQEMSRERAAGLRYDSCCWASELIFEEAQLADGRYNYGVKYVIEFKGLSSLGQRLSDTIKQNLNF